MGTPASPPLHGWTVLSLRPRGQHGGLRAAAARHGAGLSALSQVAIDRLDDPATRSALREALACPVVVWTSPNAVRAADALVTLRQRRGQAWLGVGSGTAGTLRRRGFEAASPARMDSEGLLGMAELEAPARGRVGLVTAPGGRGLLEPALAGRAGGVARADVYARRPVPLDARARRALAGALAAPRRVLLPVTSAEAFARLLAGCKGDEQAALRRVAVVAASSRLAEVARRAGFTRIAVAPGPSPAALMRAAAEAFV